MMCTTDKTFTIKGRKDCKAGGHKRNGFAEIDTGDAKIWKVELGH
jgi:uncharacterized membrane protein